jgi:hypothetical protein
LKGNDLDMPRAQSVAAQRCSRGRLKDNVIGAKAITGPVPGVRSRLRVSALPAAFDLAAALCNCHGAVGIDPDARLAGLGQPLGFLGGQFEVCRP